MAFYEDIVLDQNGNTKCELCKIPIRDSDTFIEEHIKDKEHAKLFMKKLMTQNNIKISGSRISCGICEKVLELPKMIDHINSTQHTGYMNSIKKVVTSDGGFLVLPETITNLGSAVDCLGCNRAVEFNLEAIMSHIELEAHKRARSIAVQPLNGIFSVEDSKDDLYCKICQVYFENYVEVINEHVDQDPKHLKEIEKLFLLIRGQNIDIAKFLQDPKEDKATCRKCQIDVPCNLDNLERHIKGKKHTSS